MALVKLKEVVKTEYEFVDKHGRKLTFEQEGDSWYGMVCLALKGELGKKLIISTNDNPSAFDISQVFRSFGLDSDGAFLEFPVVKVSADLIQDLGLTPVEKI